MTASNEHHPRIEIKRQIPPLGTLTTAEISALPPNLLEEAFYSQAAQSYSLPKGLSPKTYFQGLVKGPDSVIVAGLSGLALEKFRQPTISWRPMDCVVTPFAHNHFPAAYIIQQEAAVLSQLGIDYEEVLTLMESRFRTRDAQTRLLITDEDIENYKRYRIPPHMWTGKLLSGALAVVFAPASMVTSEQKERATIYLKKIRRTQQARAIEAIHQNVEDQGARTILACQIGNLAGIEERISYLFI
jgi:hypothetical protein